MHPFVIWLCGLVPGTIIETDDCVTITHTGEVAGTPTTSTLWKRRPEVSLPPHLGPVETFYRHFDGADLFSSAFKIASLTESKFSGTVPIVGSISDLIEALASAGVAFPEPSTPFMDGSGQWVYAVGHNTGCIHEWDSEVGELSDEYPTVEIIIQEWVAAVIEQ